jgi:hypothetical protein
MNKKVIKNLIPVIAVVAILLAGYFYTQMYKLKKNPNVVAQAEVADLVSKIGELVLLPEGETPTVATVSDPEALKDQTFFAQAVKGDKVLIYAQAKKAILYSVSMNKIIEVAPLNIGNAKSVTPPAPAAAKDATPVKAQ